MTSRPNANSSKKTFFILCAIALLSCLLMLGGVTQTEVIDDHALLHQREMRGCGKNPLDCFRHPQFGLYYRPILGASFSVGENLHGLKPFPFHVENLILHGVVVLLGGWFFLLLFRKSAPAIIATALFALHPLQVTTTVFIGGRTDQILLFFLFLFGVGAIKSESGSSRIGWRLLSIFGYLGAMFSKEQCLLLPILVPLLAICGAEKSEKRDDSEESFSLANTLRSAVKTPWLWFYLPPAILYFVCAAKAIPPEALRTLAGQKLGDELRWTPLLHLEMILRTNWYYVKSIFFPTPAVLHISSVGAWDIPQPAVCFASVVSATVFFVFAWKRRKEVELTTLNLWIVLTLIPCLNFIPISSQFVACYRAVPPLLGVSGVLGLLLSKLVSSETMELRRKIAGWCMVGGVAMVLSALMLADIPNWKGDLEISLAEAIADPNFVPGVSGVGGMLQKEGKFREAIVWYDRAAEAYFPGTKTAEERIAQRLTPEFRRRMKSRSGLRWSIQEMIGGTFRGRGGCQQNLKNYAAAISDYRVVLAFNPDDDEVREALVTCANQTGDMREAEKQAEELVRRNPTGYRLYALGYIYLKQSRWEEAKKTLESAEKRTTADEDKLSFAIMNALLKANAKRN